VTPIVKQYILRGIESARVDGADALVIQLDTPGGSLDLTQDITESMLASPVPIVVYVAPRGAYAASAGTFITLAAHFAGMAPGTSIGAASPVAGGGADLPATEKEKTTAVLEADLKGKAARRGEKAVAWAGQAVREAKAATADEALELGVIDAIADDVPDLLRQLDGRETEIAGAKVTLHTAGAPIQTLPMTPIEQLLHTITDPNIAFILMTLGVNGLLFELSSPGTFVPGIVGGICLLLALYSMGVLSVNYAGLLLVALAFVLFIVDIKAPTHGVLTAGGIVSFILGSLILFNSTATAPYARVSTELVVIVGVAMGAFFAFIVAKAVGSLRRKPTTGAEGLVGRNGTARTRLDPDGMVYVRGELWTALSAGGPVEAGQTVTVVEVDGFRLVVKPAA
jgi:membrane-bound serine protease (ClpP class)